MGEIEIHDYRHLAGTLRTLEIATWYGLHDNVSVFLPSATIEQLRALSLKMQEANAAGFTKGLGGFFSVSAVFILRLPHLFHGRTPGPALLGGL